MTAKTVKYAGDQLFHSISCGINPTTIYLMYFSHHKVEAIQVLNKLPCILYEELLINPNNFITRSVIDQSTMGICNNYKRTFTNPN